MKAFLLLMGFCALFNVTTAKDIPGEKQVLVQHLANGVKLYVQEHAEPIGFSSFRIVMKNGSCDEVIYTYDGKLETFEQLEQVFEGMKENSKGFNHFFRFTAPEELAVIAVGDFPREKMVSWLEERFNTVNLIETDETPLIQIETVAELPKVAMRIAFPQPISSDLNECWQSLMLQELYQQRLEGCTRHLEGSWLHPRPHFIAPVQGYALSAEEQAEKVLSGLLWQIDVLRKVGFTEQEFEAAKNNIVSQLRYLKSKSRLLSNDFLASYYADQFLLGDCDLDSNAFLDNSLKLITAMQFEDLAERYVSFFDKDKRGIHIFSPEFADLRGLNIEGVEDLTNHIASLNADQGMKEWENNNFVGESPSFILKVSTEPLALFYQLPLTDKEKRLIRAIFTTMAHKNIVELALLKRTMEKKGKKVNHVHPLRFVGYLFGNPELKSCMKKIQKSSFKWDAFVAGFARRMKEELAVNNIHQFIPGFCIEVGAHPDVITRYIEHKEWESLVKSLL